MPCVHHLFLEQFLPDLVYDETLPGPWTTMQYPQQGLQIRTIRACPLASPATRELLRQHPICHLLNDTTLTSVQPAIRKPASPRPHAGRRCLFPSHHVCAILHFIRAARFCVSRRGGHRLSSLHCRVIPLQHAVPSALLALSAFLIHALAPHGVAPCHGLSTFFFCALRICVYPPVLFLHGRTPHVRLPPCRLIDNSRVQLFVAVQLVLVFHEVFVRHWSQVHNAHVVLYVPLRLLTACPPSATPWPPLPTTRALRKGPAGAAPHPRCLLAE